MWPLGLAALLVGLAGQAYAQGQPEPAERAALPSDDGLTEVLDDPGLTADRAYELGVRFFDAGRYDAAERAWQAAYSLGRDPKLLVAIADTRQRRGDEQGTVAMLEQYLEKKPTAPDRVAVETRIATLLQSPARLLIRSEQPGRAILLDGTPVAQRTPAELEVEPGLHTVVVVGEGMRKDRRTVQLAYGQVEELDFGFEAPGEPTAEEIEQARLKAQFERDQEDRTVRRAVISTGAIAAAALVPGTVLAVLAAQQRKPETSNGADRLLIFSNVSFGLAALSGITSFTLFMTHKNARAETRDSARLRIDVRGAGASATLRF